MVKIDLKQSSGLPIFYSEGDLLPQGLTIAETSVISIDDIRSQLLNEDLNCPAIFYKKYKDIDKDNVFKNKDLKINMYLIYPNLAGIEYTKTFASKCKGYPRIFDIVYGGGLLLLQKYIPPKVTKVYKIPIKKRQKLIIPPGYTSTLINSRQNANLIVLETHSLKARPRVVLDEKKGMSYYIIRKNARQEIVRNPEYKIVTVPEKLNTDKILSKYGVTPKTPILKQIMRKYDKFNWLFEKDSLDI
jgi:oxalate decarboxylase/phosphoglucose isomerase-like protein (cupin superfamily)